MPIKIVNSEQISGVFIFDFEQLNVYWFSINLSIKIKLGRYFT